MTSYNVQFAASRRIIAEALAAFKAGNHETAWTIAQTDPLLNDNATKAAWLDWAAKR